ncbi:hypothetical protein QBC37DRAFT_480850 [Rhypophila decipiens]|uniref:Uncharacterized protein n=1 Tax=Rhypophila decipiens TaxID=261697 RepID=A0AAN6YCS5_9PEZI|nr:hypothetical protein QBC37DRAFT_480850 [Rhypophila decipiens]
MVTLESSPWSASSSRLCGEVNDEKAEGAATQQDSQGVVQACLGSGETRVRYVCFCSLSCEWRSRSFLPILKTLQQQHKMHIIMGGMQQVDRAFRQVGGLGLSSSFYSSKEPIKAVNPIRAWPIARPSEPRAAADTIVKSTVHGVRRQLSVIITPDRVCWALVWGEGLRGPIKKGVDPPVSSVLWWVFTEYRYCISRFQKLKAVGIGTSSPLSPIHSATHPRISARKVKGEESLFIEDRYYTALVLFLGQMNGSVRGRRMAAGNCTVKRQNWKNALG